MRAACAILSTRMKTRSSRRAPMPRASRSRHSLSAELADDALEIFGIAERFGKAQFGARHFGRYERGQRFIGVAERLIEAQQHFARQSAVANSRAACWRAAPRAQSRRRSRMRRSAGESRRRATGRLAIASDARPGETICASP